MAMYNNTFETIRAIAKASMATANEKKWPLYLSTKNTFLKKYDGSFDTSDSYKEQRRIQRFLIRPHGKPFLLG